MIAADHLSRRYGSVIALRDVSLEVPRAAIIGLLGPNGAGKSTLIRILTGQLRPSSGRAVVAGFDVVRQRRQLRREIGVLFEVQNLYSRLTIDENLRLFAAIFDVPIARIPELLTRFDLSDRRHARVHSLSHGMRQKVLLARAFLHRPSVLLLDEPTTGLDPHWTQVVQELIRGLREVGTTILLATHQMQTADALCDRVAIIDKGALVAYDAPQVLKQRYGKRRLDLETAHDGVTHRRSLPMDDPASAEEIATALRDGSLLTLRSEEASLDDVFRRLTGESLSSAK